VQNSQKTKGRGELVALARGRKKARVSWDLDLVGKRRRGKWFWWRLACSVVEKVQACLLRDYVQEDKRLKGGCGGGEVSL
jgi:hypothetical protein